MANESNYQVDFRLICHFLNTTIKRYLKSNHERKLYPLVSKSPWNGHFFPIPSLNWYQPPWIVIKSCLFPPSGDRRVPGLSGSVQNGPVWRWWCLYPACRTCHYWFVLLFLSVPVPVIQCRRARIPVPAFPCSWISCAMLPQVFPWRLSFPFSHLRSGCRLQPGKNQ